MNTIVVDVFGGEIPKLDPSLLNNENASVTNNCDLERGNLSAWRADEVVSTILSTDLIGVDESSWWRLRNELKDIAPTYQFKTTTGWNVGTGVTLHTPASYAAFSDVEANALLTITVPTSKEYFVTVRIRSISTGSISVYSSSDATTTTWDSVGEFYKLISSDGEIGIQGINTDAIIDYLHVYVIDKRPRSVLKYAGNWYAFNNKVDVVQAPIIGDRYNRVVITGLDVPRVTDEYTVERNNFKTYKLGIPKPSNKASVVVTGTPGTIEDTAWVYTYVREWADNKTDEGPPSEPTDIVEFSSGQTATLTGIKIPSDWQDINISKVRIYRIGTSTAGAQYQYVGEVVVTDATDKTFVDSVTNANLGEVIPSSGYTPPPDDLQGIISVGNGVLAGFTGNTLHMCEVFQTNGWNEAYKYNVEHNIVGLGALDNTVVVTTEGYPALVYVQAPEEVQIYNFKEPLPCLSKDSIISTRSGVFYASSYGMIKMDTNGPSIISEEIMDARDWVDLNPSSIRSVYHDNKIFFFWKGEEVRDEYGKIIKLDTGEGGFILSLTDKNVGLTRTSIKPESMFRDWNNPSLYYCTIRQDVYDVYEWSSSYLTYKNFKWKSKEFVSNLGRINYSAGRVLPREEGLLSKEEQAAIIKSIIDNLLLNGLKSEVNSHEINTFPINGSVLSRYTSYSFGTVMHLYVDGKKRWTRKIEDDRIFRLPTQFAGKRFYIELEGNLPISQIQIATSAMEIV